MRCVTVVVKAGCDRVRSPARSAFIGTTARVDDLDVPGPHHLIKTAIACTLLNSPHHTMPRFSCGISVRSTVACLLRFTF